MAFIIPLAMEKFGKTTSVKVSLQAKNYLDQIASDRGIGKIELVSRMAEWLARQDRTLQAIVLGQIDPGDEFKVLELIKKRLMHK